MLDPSETKQIVAQEQIDKLDRAPRGLTGVFLVFLGALVGVAIYLIVR
jgi:hypothetical protein